jgi:TPR repeat protein
MYRNGFGIEQNYEKAIELYLKAVAAGVSNSQNSLGEMYEGGLGTPVNLPKAIELYQLAAKQKYQKAIDSLKRLGIAVAE